MKIKLMVLATAIASAAVASSAAKGSCIKKAKSLSGSQAVTLVNEWIPGEDGEDGEFTGTGAAYYSVKLSRGQAYTIWIQGGDASRLALDVDTNENYYDDREDEPSASFDVTSLDGGDIQVAYLYADDWDTDPEDGDPKTGRYVVCISGDENDIGAKTTLHFQRGIRSFTTVGSIESPKAISFGNSWKSFSGKLVAEDDDGSEGEYNFSASLKAGRKYRVYTRGGNSTYQLSLNVDGVSDDADPGDFTDPQYTNANNDALILIPSKSGKYTFQISEGIPKQSFKFYYRAVPTLPISSHNSIPLLEEHGYMAKFVPGRMASTHNYYDEIIDEHLCKIYLAKGERWMFETEGATKEQKMIAYGPTGKVLTSNESLDGSDFDTRVVITAASSGVHYVGVYDPSLDVESVADAGPITLTATYVSDMAPPDEWDPADNVYATATPLVVYPDSTNVVDTAPFEHGPHRLSANDVYDVFKFNCRKGYTYTISGRFADSQDMTTLTLDSKLFIISSSAEKTVAVEGGTVTPPEARDPDSATSDLIFTAAVSGTHYLRVWVAEGRGLDYPPYTISVKASSGGEVPLGIIGVRTEGAAGTWSINTETVRYGANTTLTAAKNLVKQIKPNAVTGFSGPSARTGLSVPEWKDGSEIMWITNRYSDKYDSSDATQAGAVAITPKSAPAKADRTLWKSDAADHFKFTASGTAYYNFELEDTTASGTGDAVFSIYGAGGTLCEGQTKIERLKVPSAGVYYIKVTHGTAAKADTSYSLVHSRASVGAVRFTNSKGVAVSTYVANETAADAVLYVARTGNEGATRVVVHTKAGTAVPGTNYYPVVTNEICWAAGDKSVKPLKVRLIPELNAAWSASNLKFSVKLLPISNDLLEEGEYAAIIPADTATVTIKNTTAKKCGTVSLTGFASGADELASAGSVKKPVVTGKAGETLRLVFSRTVGKGGAIAVKVSSPSAATAKKSGDTAVSGTDYAPFAQTISWADGDDEDKTVEIPLNASTGYIAEKKFTLSIAAVKTAGNLATLSAKTATVKVLNDKVSQTAAQCAKGIPAAAGLKMSATGAWFKSHDGVFRSGTVNGVLTCTLTGPGLFVTEPTLVAPAGSATELKCQFANSKAGLNETVQLDAATPTKRIVRLIPAGTTTVKFSLANVAGGAYATFATLDEGKPCSWTRFASVTPAWPMDKALTEKSQSTLAWTLPEAIAAEPGLYCRVRFGASASAMAVVKNDLEGACKVDIPTALAAAKKYFWTVDYAYGEAGLSDDAVTALAWTSGPVTWSFSTVKDEAPVTEVDASAMDMAGNNIANQVAEGKPVEVIQGVNVKSLKFDIDGVKNGDAGLVGNKFRILAGALPKGVKITANGLLTGAPTEVGTTTALLQSWNGTKKVYGTTIPVVFNVLPAGTSIGSWTGVLREEGSGFYRNPREAGKLTVSVTSAGKITAKVLLAGVTYTFSGSAGFDELLDRDEGLAGVTRHMRVELSTTVKAVKNKKTTAYKDNILTITLPDGALTNSVALAEAVGSAALSLNVLNAAKTAVTEDVAYKAELYRNNGATEAGKEAAGTFAGYYTLALAPNGVSPEDGIPAGNGYLTLTVSDTCAVKASGVLADGTAVSFSTIGQPVGADLADPKGCVFAVPVYAGNGNYVIAGVAKIFYESKEDGVLPVLDPESTMVWSRTASSLASRSGAGFEIEAIPTGGWYDKVVNLQTYYLNRDFEVSAAESGDELPDEALATSAYTFTPYSTPNGLEVKFNGNAMSVAARALKKNPTTGLYDFGTSANPWAVSLKFTRATGIVTGTLSAWEWTFRHDEANTYPAAQKQISGLTHKGVLLFTRDGSSASPLDGSALTAGFFLVPATASTKTADKNKAWKASLPFNILTVSDGDRDWNEAEE